MFSKYPNIITCILIIFAIGTFLWLCKVLFLSGYPDFSDYYIGAEHIFLKNNPYLTDSRYFTQQVYPPFALVAFLPLLVLPYVIAARVWVFLSIIALIATLYLCSKIYGLKFYSPVNLFLAGLIFLSFPLKFTLGLGQINTFILLLITLCFYYLNKKRGNIAGIYFAFPVLIKFFAVLLIPYFIYLKKWQLIKSFFLTTLIATIIICFFIPLPIFIHYYDNILPNLLSSWKGDYYNQALSGFLMRSIQDITMRSYLRVIISLIFIIITLIPIFRIKKKTQQRINIEIAAIITLSVLINNFSWQHHFVFLVLPFLITVYTLFNTKYKRKGKNKLYVVLFISYLLIATNLPNPFLVPIILRSHVFYGGVLLWGFIWYMLVRFKLE
jgi:alpha-1,2-mannosyltransferase